MIGQAVAVAIPAIPLGAGLAGLFVSPGSRRVAARLSISAIATTAFLALWATADALGWWDGIGVGRRTEVAFTPARFGELDVTVVLRVDGVSALLASAVTLVALAVAVYSVEHLAADPRYAPYAATITLFTGAMLLVVSAADLITVLVGWELMGLCSYLLIGHDRTNPAASGAARKAFIVTRIGDIGFILGVVLIGVDAGSFAFKDLGSASGTTLGIAGLLLFVGIVGKSAQFPLHTWLPDAMAGPAPVSALIHAATMVAAGIYLVSRLPGVFSASAATTVMMAIVGVLSVLLGACAAVVAGDIKRVLAYSTISQLGYMVAGLAVSPGVGPSLFHLFTHAAFKALLFLCAGTVLVAVGGSAITGMGGLARTMPITAGCTAVGLAALAGIPPLSGFWSKSGILEAAWEHMSEGGTTGLVGWTVFVGGMIGVPITALYCARLWFRVFAGTYRGEPIRPRDPGGLARFPVLGLAAAAALVGLLGLVGKPAGWWSVEVFYPGWVTPSLEITLTSLGVAVAYWSWRFQTGRPRLLARWCEAGFYCDLAQNVLVVRPARALASEARRFDELLVDGAVRGIARMVSATGGVVSRAHAPLARYVSFTVGGAVVLVLLVLLIAGLH